MTLGRRLTRNLAGAPMGVRPSGTGPSRDGRSTVLYVEDKAAWRTNIVHTAVGPFAGRVPDYPKKKHRNDDAVTTTVSYAAHTHTQTPQHNVI